MDIALWARIRELHQQGYSDRAIGRTLRCCPRTAKKAIEASTPPAVEANRASGLDPHHDAIQALIKKYPKLSAVRILEEIQKDGYAGTIYPVRRYARKIRPYTGRVYQEADYDPGEAMQVDWGNCGWVRIGETLRRVSVFVAVLCFSRLCFIKFTLSQQAVCFYRAMQEALQFFQGCPEKVIFDNLKAGVLDGHGRAARLNPDILALCDYFGVHPIACARDDPESKGTVECGVDYVKKNALQGRDEELQTWEGYQRLGPYWRDHIANVRIHDTTRERPIDRFEKEKPCLRPLPAFPYDTDDDQPTVVSKHCRVRFDGNKYSVPPAYCTKPVAVKANDEALWVLHDGKEIARHHRCYEKRKTCCLEEHRHAARRRRHRARASDLENRFDGLGPEARAFHARLRTVPVKRTVHLRKLLKLADLYGRNDVLRALKEALEGHVYDAASVELIVLQHRRQRHQPSLVCPNPKRRELIEDLHLPTPDPGVYDALFGLEREEAANENAESP